MSHCFTGIQKDYFQNLNEGFVRQQKILENN